MVYNINFILLVGEKSGMIFSEDSYLFQIKVLNGFKMIWVD